MRVEAGSSQAAAAALFLSSRSAGWTDRARAKAAHRNTQQLAQSVSTEVDNHDDLERLSYQQQGDA